MVRACLWMGSSLVMTLMLVSVSAAQGFPPPPMNLFCERMATYYADGRPSEMIVRAWTNNTAINGAIAFFPDFRPDNDEALAYVEFYACAQIGTTKAETVVMQSEAAMLIPIGATDYAPQCDTTTYVFHVNDARGGQTTIGYGIISQCLATYVVAANPDFPGAGVSANSATVHATASIYLTGWETRPTFIRGANTINNFMSVNAAIAVDVAGGQFVAIPLGFGQWQVNGFRPPQTPFMPPSFYFAIVPENSQLNIEYSRRTQIGAALNCSAEVNYSGAFTTNDPNIESVIKAYKGAGVFTVTVP